MVGTRLGRYEITATLGAGGMGEVYRAKDASLKREVAVKILLSGLTADPERRKRFVQEAQAASALNHPNILVVHDVGLHDGAHYIVSELVEGESLRNVIKKGPVALKKLLDIAVQLADGLSAAHKAGIVHRDLKPENVMVTRDGRVKILDFGLAKLTVAPSGNESDETLSQVISEIGTIQGTVPYMSPEQAAGKSVDFRSDQFSFGLILYEMATAQRLFIRKTPAETLAAIINDEPPALSSINPRVPAPVLWLIERCLRKDPVDRYDSTTDLYRELLSLRDHLSQTSSEEIKSGPDATKRSRSKWFTFSAIALTSAAIAVLLTLSLSRPDSLDISSYRFTALATDQGLEGDASWSPDGKTIAYEAEVNGLMQILTRSLIAATPAQITNSTFDCQNPFWSNDGSRIFYWSQESLWSVGAAGGTPELILKEMIRGSSSPDGKALVFTREDESLRGSVWISSPLNGTPKKYTLSPFAERAYFDGFPRFSPDGKKVGIWIQTLDSPAPEFWILPYPDGKPYRALLSFSKMEPGTRDTTRFSWLPDSNHFVFEADLQGKHGKHLWLADIAHDKIYPVTTTTSNEYDPAVSADGKMIAYTTVEENVDLVEISVEGGNLKSMLATSRNEYHAAWSPISAQYAYVTDRTGDDEIWLKSLQEGWERPLITQKDFGQDRTEQLSYPSFSPDGKRVVYGRRGQKGDLSVWVSAIVGGPPVRLAKGQEFTAQSHPEWSPDGNWVTYVYGKPDSIGLAKVPSGGGGAVIELQSKAILDHFKWSPDGQWITFPTNEGLYLISSDGVKKKFITSHIAQVHGWNKEGTAIYMIRNESSRVIFTSVSVETGSEKKISELGPTSLATEFAGFSLTRDGKSFVTSLLQRKGDVWLLEGFHLPRRPWPFSSLSSR